MEAASKISFDDDEDLDLQAAALQNCWLSLEENTVNMGTKATAEFNFLTLATGIKDFGASTSFVTATDKVSNAMNHKTQLRTANGQKCCTTHAGKRAFDCGNKAIQLAALDAPTFLKGHDSSITTNSLGEQTIIHKKRTFIDRTLTRLIRRIHHREKGSDNIFRLQDNLTKLKSHHVLGAQLELPKNSSDLFGD